MTTELLCQHCGDTLTVGVASCRTCGAPSQIRGDGTVVAPAAFDWDHVFQELQEAIQPRYRLVRRIGIGGMAGVFLAEEARLERPVAIKVLLPSLTADKRFLARFEREARTMARISHPNIVTVYDVDHSDTLHFFVMAWVPGRSLAHILASQSDRLPIRIGLHWLAQAGSALFAAHRIGIIHRDVKPGNILLDAEGNALATDFGIAKTADQPGLTSTGMIVGTPAYMSPEQCQGDANLAASSDQYSLGAVAYELITGRPPFRGNPISILHDHMTKEAVPPSELRPDCPHKISDAICRMLAKDASDRFEDLLAALGAMGAVAIPEVDPARALLKELAVPRRIELQPARTTLTALGETVPLSARLFEWNGTEPRSVIPEWRSSDPDVVRIDADGRATAIANGRATVHARWNGLAGSAEITVEQRPVRIALDADRLVLSSIGECVAVRARILDRLDHPMAAPHAWRSAGPAIVKVDDTGNVQAVGNGRTTVECSAVDVRGTVEVVVEQVARSISLEPRSLHFDRIGNETAIRVSLQDALGSPIEPVRPQFESSNGRVLRVNAEGLVTAVAEGTGQIRVTAGGLTSAVPAMVRRSPSHLRVTPAEIRFDSLGDFAVVSASVIDTHGQPIPSDALWMSSDPRIAMIDAGGTVTSISNGTCYIEASAGEFSTRVPVVVNQIPATLSVRPQTVVLSSLGDGVQLHLTSRDRRGREIQHPPRFISSDSDVATVDAKGIVSARSEGVCTIAVTVGSAHLSAQVHVRQEPASVRVEPDRFELDGIGASVQLEAAVFDAAGQPIRRTLRWSSSDPDLAVVDQSGTVRAVRTGEATIRVDCDGVVGAAQARVTQTVARISLDPDMLELVVGGEARRIVVSASDPLGSPVFRPALRWESSNPDVARVENGHVVPVAAGMAVIRAVCRGSTATAVARVDERVTRIEVEPAELSFSRIGETRSLRAFAVDAAGRPTTERLHWKSGNPEIAAVSDGGLVQSVGRGSTQISVTTGNARTVVAVSVVLRPARIKLANENIRLRRPRDETVVSATVLDADGRPLNTPLIWESSDPSVVSIDQEGRVVGLREGEAEIIATAGNIQKRTSVIIDPLIAPIASIQSAESPHDLATQQAGTIALEPAPLEERARSERQWPSRGSIARLSIGLGLVTVAVVAGIQSVRSGISAIDLPPAVVTGPQTDSTANPTGPGAPSPTGLGTDTTDRGRTAAPPSNRSDGPKVPATRVEPGADPNTQVSLFQSQISDILNRLFAALSTRSDADIAKTRSIAYASAVAEITAFALRDYESLSWTRAGSNYRLPGGAVSMDVQVRLRPFPGRAPQPPVVLTIMFDRADGPWRISSLRTR